MSFYGNQYLEFQKFFYNFLLKKQNVDIGGIIPENTHDKFIINTSDNWIQIAPYAGEPGVDFAHSLSDSGSLISDNGVHKADRHEHDSEKITHEDCLLINNLEFDEAGHIKAITPKYYTMPSRLYWKVLDETSATAIEE